MSSSSPSTAQNNDFFLLQEKNETLQNVDEDYYYLEDGEVFDMSILANLTDEEYMEVVLGPRNVGWALLIPLTAAYTLIFISGLLGNFAVCLVIIKIKSMHTATNYYLFSLAVSDLIMLVLGLPNDLAIYWQQYPWVMGEAMCKARSLVSEMTSYSSVLTIVSFSMERYLAICHPLYSKTMSGFHRAVRIIALVWTISLVSALPYAFFTRINYIDRPLGSGNYLPETAFCALLKENIYPQSWPIYELSSFLFFLFPMVVLVVLYIRMGLRLQRATKDVTRSLPTVGSHHRKPSLQNNCHSANIHVPPPASVAAVVSASSRRCSYSSSHSQGSLSNHEPACERGAVAGTTATVTYSSGAATSSERHLTSQRAGVIRMLTAVVVSFFLCWAPFHAQRLGYVYFNESPFFRTINEYLYYISGFLYYLSATLNPILYNLMSLRYREAFKRTLCTCDVHAVPPATATGVHTAAAAANKTHASALNSTSGGKNKRSATMVALRGDKVKRTSLKPSDSLDRRGAAKAGSSLGDGCSASSCSSWYGPRRTPKRRNSDGSICPRTMRSQRGGGCCYVYNSTREPTTTNSKDLPDIQIISASMEQSLAAERDKCAGKMAKNSPGNDNGGDFVKDFSTIAEEEESMVSTAIVTASDKLKMIDDSQFESEN